MFVEYMAVKDKKEAIAFLDAGAKVKPDEKEDLYIVKEQEQYQVVLKIKKMGKKFSEQRWFLYPCEKGIKAKREMTVKYGIEVFVTCISAILGLIFFMLAFLMPDKMAVFVWLAIVALFAFLLVSWRKLFNPSVALKIFLIRIL